MGLLVDQFESAIATVRKPAALCLPASANGEGVRDPATHLQLYKLKQGGRTPSGAVSR